MKWKLETACSVVFMNLLFHCSSVVISIFYCDALHTRWFIGWCSKSLHTTPPSFLAIGDIEKMLLSTCIACHWAIILKAISLSFRCELFTSKCMLYRLSLIACCLLLRWESCLNLRAFVCDHEVLHTTHRCVHFTCGRISIRHTTVFFRNPKLVFPYQ
jgi:hypothetical protein